MLYGICAVVAVIIFGILAYYLIKTLLTAQKTLERISDLSDDVTVKLNKIDSTLQSLSNLGDIYEKKTYQMREEYLHPKLTETPPRDLSEDLVTLLMISLKLGRNFLRRK